MKKIITLLILTLLIPCVFAQDEEQKAGITPDSIFYKLDVFFDNAKVFFTPSSLGKAKIRLNIMQERAAEMNMMVQKNKTAEVKKAELEGQKQIEKFESSIKNMEIKDIHELNKSIQSHNAKLKTWKQKLQNNENQDYDRGISSMIGALEGSMDEIEKKYINCGADSKCWEEALKTCEPAIGNPNEETTATIEGLQNEKCIIKFYHNDDLHLTCELDNYATFNPENSDDLYKSCKGKGLTLLKQFSEIKVGRYTPSPEECEKQTDTRKREGCFRGIAVANKDVDYCERIDYEEGDTPGRCYFNMALGSNDFSICDRIEATDHWHTGCYFQAAKITKDTSYCDNIKNEEEIPGCYFAVIGDISICEKATDSDGKDECYRVAASANKDGLLCGNIVDSDRQENCYVNLARNLQDSTLCEKITNSERKEHCYRYAEGNMIINEKTKPVTERNVNGRLLYFYNDNCPYCDKQEPIIAEIEENFKDMTVERINVAESDDFKKYNLQGTPSMIYIGFKNCTSIRRGYTEYDQTKQWLYGACAGSVSD